LADHNKTNKKAALLIKRAAFGFLLFRLCLSVFCPAFVLLFYVYVLLFSIFRLKQLLFRRNSCSLDKLCAEV